MEYQGIITGIGDKELEQNLIKPEYDAIINDFIIGKNTILEGLVLNGKNLSAGTCILCGYRGIIEKSKELDTTAYVYGEFTLNSIYGGSGEDDFNIVTSNIALNEIEYKVNPTEITSAGTYYLLLYVNGVEQIDREHSYPKNSQYSVETEYVGDNAVISETATTPTEVKTITNELGEEETVIVTDLHNEYPNRVANTEYVQVQINKEIDYDDFSGKVVDQNNRTIFEYKLVRKAKQIIGEIDFSNANSNAYFNPIYGDLQIPEGFYPKEVVYIVCVVPSQTGYVAVYKITTGGKIQVHAYVGGSYLLSSVVVNKLTIGYLTEQ